MAHDSGTFIMVACFVLFYLMTAWVLSLRYKRQGG